jgi:hypothetical protein
VLVILEVSLAGSHNPSVPSSQDAHLVQRLAEDPVTGHLSSGEGVKIDSQEALGRSQGPTEGRMSILAT